ncbi:unnamed protein product [Rotaria sp. Silwood2]|nr:unnamed protein product [Rotaria sp. Silwood2]CAF4471179.1 unnamed protein product [Rotaria sp. Silwood2]CAF4483541.1 unnamed protein product [Rotaria sp. Silwood2]
MAIRSIPISTNTDRFPVNNRKQSQKQQPTVAPLAKSTKTKISQGSTNDDEDFNENEVKIEEIPELSKYKKLKPPKDSQLPPWSIAGPTIGQIFGAPPPY